MPTFLLEVGTEELPADFLDHALQQWRDRLPQSLRDQLLTPETLELYATPRRLALLMKGLPAQQPDREEEIKGPPAKAAFKDGKPTKAAEGFARKQGVAVEALEVRPTEKGDFIFLRKQIAGRPAAEILMELVPQWIFTLEGRRFMRWADGDLRFPRPIRWLVTLLDDRVLPLMWENGSETVKSDRLSRGHRVLHPEPVTIPQAGDYVECLGAAYIEVDPTQRQTKIEQDVEAAAQKVNGYAKISPALLQEVTNLVEYPTAVVGKFDPEFLQLPAEVSTTVMVKHQRYFPVLKNQGTGELLPYFITVSNGDPASSDIIAAGNERVIRARLADAQFFYNADMAKPLESYLPQLEKVTFQEDLGSVRLKVDRLSKIALKIAQQLQLSAAETSTIARAALLCKADLVTQMVYEFPELQGVMGENYARASQEPEAVATAIFEHYLPRGAGDKLPQTIAGQVVGLADRLDTLVSIFSLTGMRPTGSSDPFALRRAANAIVNITWAGNLGINLQQLLTEIAQKSELIASLQEFFLQRLRTQLQEERGIDYDLVNAVLGENDPEYADRALQDLLDMRDRALFLQAIRNNGQLDAIYETVNRSTRLAAQGDLDTVQLEPKGFVNPELFEKSSEQAFLNAIVELLPKTQASQASISLGSASRTTRDDTTRNYQQLVDALSEIAPFVSRFFDGEDSVLVMDKNPEIRRNRLNLLGLLRNHTRVLADFGAIVKG
ncbi:MAG: glycine--tRNA ligase subunit beta [Hormoscilla sp. GM102CHS1]|nr:glycine--tRNA ligase subunit beta [Hormoscilla sp. GM102CHS1]